MLLHVGHDGGSAGWKDAQPLLSADCCTQYWKSNPMYWCELCRCWMNDTKAAKLNHERGAKHQENLARSKWLYARPVCMYAFTLQSSHGSQLATWRAAGNVLGGNQALHRERGCSRVRCTVVGGPRTAMMCCAALC